MKNIIISLVAMQFLLVGVSSAQLYNDGAIITILPDALLHVQGDFINQGGEITNGGRIEIGGNWENTVMSFPMTPGSGEVILVGADQTIGGDFPTLYHDLVVEGEQLVTLTATAGISNSVDLGSAVLNLNENVLHIISPEPGTLVSSTGGVLAETSDTYGYVRWDIGERMAGNYTIPFVNNFENAVPLVFDLETAGSGMDGYLLFSTYSSENDNTPLPLGVADINIEGDDTGLALVDRYWVIDAVDYTERPTGTASFTFDADNEIGGTNEIDIDRLATIVYDTLTGWTTFASSAVQGSTVTTSLSDNYSTYTLWSNETSSVTDFNDFEEFKVFPNPSTDLVYVSVESQVSEEAEFTLVDQVGRVLIRKKVLISTGISEFGLDINYLPLGLYNLVLQGETVRSLATISKI